MENTLNINEDFDLKAFKAEVEKELSDLERTQSQIIITPLFCIFEPSTGGSIGCAAYYYYSPWWSFMSKQGFVESSKWFIQNLENWLKKRQYETQQWLESQMWSSTKFSEWLTQVLEEWRQQLKTEVAETQKWLKDLYLAIR